MQNNEQLDKWRRNATQIDKNRRKKKVLEEKVNETIGQWEGALIVLYPNFEIFWGRDGREVSYLETKADQRFSAFYEILNFEVNSLNRKSTDKEFL